MALAHTTQQQRSPVTHTRRRLENVKIAIHYIVEVNTIRGLGNWVKMSNVKVYNDLFSTEF